MGVMRQESAFSSKAESSAGALGLMQIMPLTGQYLARVPMSEPWDPAILLEPSVNVMLGVKYLSELQNRFGDLEPSWLHTMPVRVLFNVGLTEDRKTSLRSLRRSLTTRRGIMWSRLFHGCDVLRRLKSSAWLDLTKHVPVKLPKL